MVGSTSLLRQKPKTLSWMPEATQAFLQLKSFFCSAPALTHPDSYHQFVVELDAFHSWTRCSIISMKGLTSRTLSMCILLQ